MDVDEGDDQETAPIGHMKATSSHDVYMVDTPKGSDDEEQWDATRDHSPEKQSKRRRKRRSRSCLDKESSHADPAIEQGEPVDDEHAIVQPSEQDNLDKQSVPGEDNSPDDLTPDKLLEQKNLHKRLVATVRSLKKQKRKLKTAEEALRIRWSKVLNTADKYGDSHRTNCYPKRKLLPNLMRRP